MAKRQSVKHFGGGVRELVARKGQVNDPRTVDLAMGSRTYGRGRLGRSMGGRAGGLRAASMRVGRRRR